jgi:glycosyltransferase involved in cell wall biosynthesis
MLNFPYSVNVVVSEAECDMNATTGIARAECGFVKQFTSPICITSIRSLSRPNRCIRYIIFALQCFGITIKSRKRSLVHFMSQQLVLVLCFIPRPYRVFITVFDLFPFLPKKYGLKLSFIEKIKYALIKKQIKKCDQIFTISEEIRQEINKEFSFPLERIQVTYMGVNHESFKPLELSEVDSDEPKVLFVGSEAHRKNFTQALQALSLIVKVAPNVKLIKVGKAQFPDVRQKHLELIEKLDLQKHVIFTGFVEEEDLVKWYNRATLLLLPSLSEAGFTLPVAEAMASGCPCVVSDLPVLRETVQDAALFVNPNDSNNIAQQCLRFIEDASLRDVYRKKGLKQTSSLTWAKSSDLMLDYYSHVK